MTSRFPTLFAGVALTLLLAPLLPAVSSAQELSAKELKKAVKEAGKAFGAGRYDQAIGLYDQILASTPAGDARRGDALYASAMIRLSPDAAREDAEAARRHLEELAASFPRHPRRLEIAAARALFAGLDSARAEVRSRSAELEEKTAAFEAEREQAAAEREAVAGESEAAGESVKSLEARLRKIRSERSACRAELEKKEEALQKLRDALVGGG